MKWRKHVRSKFSVRWESGFERNRFICYGWHITGATLLGDRGVHWKNNTRLIVLPPEHRKAFLLYYHVNGSSGGHACSQTICKELIKTYYWPGYVADVRSFCRSCHSCQLQKAARKGRSAPMKVFKPRAPDEWLQTSFEQETNYKCAF